MPTEKSREYHRHWQETNKDKIRMYDKRSDVKVPTRFSLGRTLAKSRKLLWSLTLEQYRRLLSEPCHYCKKVLVGKEHGVGLDRINNHLGYTEDNVLPCCGECNRIRQDILTVREMEVAMKAVLRLRR